MKHISLITLAALTLGLSTPTRTHDTPNEPLLSKSIRANLSLGNALYSGALALFASNELAKASQERKHHYLRSTLLWGTASARAAQKYSASNKKAVSTKNVKAKSSKKMALVKGLSYSALSALNVYHLYKMAKRSNVEGKRPPSILLNLPLVHLLYETTKRAYHEATTVFTSKSKEHHEQH